VLQNFLEGIFSFERDADYARIIGIGLIGVIMLILWIWINKSDKEQK